jgi:16S rRNA (cytidine1402-2'-O)-methyltransferase
MEEHGKDRPRADAPADRSPTVAALYVVATPIGNLADVSRRALSVLAGATHVFAEDTRVSQKLLAHHGIVRRLESLHQHSGGAKLDRVMARLAAGESVAYLTDAGTPGVSDPGAELVRRALVAGVPVIPVPGPSAAVSAVSAAGLAAASWVFVGFLPRKAAARQAALERLRALPFALVFYEAPLRVVETVDQLARSLGGERAIVICRELTKLHEQIVRLPLSGAAQWLAGHPDRTRGEFVLVVDVAEPAVEHPPSQPHLRGVLGVLLAELPVAQSARLAARIAGVSREVAYAEAVSLQHARQRPSAEHDDGPAVAGTVVDEGEGEGEEQARR